MDCELRRRRGIVLFVTPPDLGPAFRREVAGAFVLLTALTVILTWPQALHLSSHTALHDDPFFSIWRLSWVAHALPNDPAHLFDANIFYPHRLTLAFSDAMPLEAAIAAPWLWAGVNPVLVYNVLLLGGIVSSGLGMFVLARSLMNDADAALVSAAIFTLVPYRVEHFMHLELQWTVWMPLTLWAIHRAYSEGSFRFGALAGVLLWLQMLSSVYYGAFLGLIGATLALLLAATGPRPARSVAGPFCLAALVVAILSAPYAIPYVQNTRALGPRDPGEVATFSARFANYLSAPQQNWLWGWTWLDYPGNELHLFPGVAAVALAVLGFIMGPRRIARVYLALLATAVVLSLGTNGWVYGWLYAHVRALQGFRAPARFAVLACCALAILAGFGFQSLRRLVKRPQAQRPLLAAVLVIIGIEYGSAPMTLGAIPTVVPDLSKTIRQMEPSPLIEFPMADLDLSVDYMYWSTYHWHPLVNGYSGYKPPDYTETQRLMRTFPDARSLERLRALDVRHIVIHQTYYNEQEYSNLLLLLLRTRGVTKIGRYRDWIGWADIFELTPAPY
jgi:hypothetical protein